MTTLAFRIDIQIHRRESQSATSVQYSAATLARAWAIYDDACALVRSQPEQPELIATLYVRSPGSTRFVSVRSFYSWYKHDSVITSRRHLAAQYPRP